MIRSVWLPLLLGAVLVALTVTIVRLGDLSHSTLRFLIAFAGMFTVYVAAVVAVPRSSWRRLWIVIMAVAVLMRVVLLCAPPSLSTDIYRYLWEGRVVASGENPFDLAPDAEPLEPLRDDNYEHINHSNLATIYPPLAQAVFYVGAVIWPTLTMQKILFVAFDLATLVLLMVLLRRRGRNPALSVIYGWSPLVALEFAHSGHMDSVGIFFLVLAIYMFERRSPLAGMVVVAVSVLAKFMALVLLPFFLMKRRYLWGIGVVAVVIVGGYLPFASAGYRLFASLKEYGTYWYFNSAAFSVLAGLVTNTDVARLALLGAAGLFALFQARRQADLLRYAFLVIGFALLMSPTVYPWYITWIVPFLCFFPSLGWISFTGLVVASYAVWPAYHETGEWVVGPQLLVLQYVPFFVLLLVDVWRRRRANGVT